MYDRQIFDAYSEESLTKIVSKLNDENGYPIRLSVSFADCEPSLVTVKFYADAHVEFIVAATFASADRRDYFTNRWMACHSMFTAAKQAHPGLIGRCRFWVDDLPKGSGLAFSGNSPSTILVPDSVFFESNGYELVRRLQPEDIRAWEDRAPKVFWRGASTGSRAFLRLSNWREIPRFKLCLTAKEQNRPDIYDVAISNIVQVWDEKELAEISDAGIIGDEVPNIEFMNYRYSIDIDGNTCSWPGLFIKLMLKNTVIKVDSYPGYRQWYYDRLVPWKNFVPLSEGMQELPQLVEYLLANPEESERIALRGQALSDSLAPDNVLQSAIAAVCEGVRN